MYYGLVLLRVVYEERRGEGSTRVEKETRLENFAEFKGVMGLSKEVRSLSLIPNEIETAVGNKGWVNRS